MFRKASTIYALATLCVAAPAFAAPDLETFKKQVDTAVEARMKEQNVPGVAVAVLRKGEIVIAKGYGAATVEHNVPVTPDTIFQTGSVGKMFTAAAVMTQVEQGKIKLDDLVSKYLPGTPPSWAPITIRQLITHTSGIPNFGREFNLQRDYTDDELLKIFYALPLDFKPGTRWSYSNTAYEVTGILLKKATGKPYLEIIENEIFKPLGMKTARGISDADIVPNRASGYEVVKGQLKNQTWVSPTMNSTADGSLYVSLNDMNALARGVEQGKVLSADGWKQTYTPVKLASGKPFPYGFGWSVVEAGGKPRYHHGGAWQGFRTFYSRYLGEDLSVIVLTNSGGAHPDTFNDAIAGAWDPALTANPPAPKPEPEVAAHATALLEKARAGALKEQDLPLAKKSFVDMANPFFAETLKGLGPLTKLELTNRRELGDDISYTYTATFGDQTRKVEYAVAPGNKAASFMVGK